MFDIIESGGLISILGAIGFFVVVGLTFFVAGKYIKQMKDDKASGELAKYNWDGIREYKNDSPIGWSLAFLGTIVWGIWYFLYGYPVNAYSQIGEYNEEVKSYNEKFESKWQDPDKDTLVKMGESFYLVQCSPCHGETAEGMDGKAANLVNWGHEEGIVNVVNKGSKGLNYPMGEMPAGLVDDETAKKVAAYVMAEVSDVKKTKHPELVEEGRAMFAVCAGCHGPDGKGMGGMAPDLSKYGTNEFVKEVLDKGKKGHIGTMPSFKDRFADVQYRAVGTYILSLSEQ